MAQNRKQSRKSFGTTLAYVRWFDSAICKDESCTIDDLSGCLENESCGILVRETEDQLSIALDRCLDTENLRLVLSIPKINIRAIRRIKV